MNTLFHRVCVHIGKKYGLTPDQLLERSRAPHLSHPRQEAMCLLIECGYTQQGAGHAFNRDHTTVICAIKAVERRDPVLFASLTEIGRKIRDEFTKDYASVEVKLCMRLGAADRRTRDADAEFAILKARVKRLEAFERRAVT